MVDDEDEADRPRIGRSLGRFAMAASAVLLIGGLGGYLFGRTAPERASSALLGDRVVTEASAGDARRPADTDEPAPTSGDHVGQPACGWSQDPVGADVQLATLSAGLVVVQYRPDAVAPAAVSSLRSWVDEHPGVVLAAPNDALARPVVATAWRRRLPLGSVELSYLSAFVTAYQDAGPRPGPCRTRL